MSLAVSHLSAIANLGFELDDGDFIALFFTQGSGYNLCSGDNWSTFDNFIAIVNEQHLVELDSITLGYIQAVYFNNLSRGDIILPAAGFNNCVNLGTS